MKLLAWVGYSDESVEPRLGCLSRSRLREPRDQTTGFRVLSVPRRRARGDSRRHRSDGAGRARLVSLRPARRRPPSERILVLSWAEPCRLSIEDRNSSRTSPARRLRRSTERACSSPSRRSPETLQRSVLPRRSRVSKGCSSPPATFPGRGRQRRQRLVRCDSAGGRTARARRRGRRRERRQCSRDDGAARNALRAFALDRMEAVVDDDPSEPPRRGDRDGIATVTYVVVDAAAGVCRYTSAGHHRLSSRSRTAVSSSSRRSRVAARRGDGHQVHTGRSRAAGRDGARPLHRRPGRAPRAADRRRLGSTAASGSRRPREPQKLVEYLLERLAEELERETTSRSWRCDCLPPPRDRWCGCRARPARSIWCGTHFGAGSQEQSSAAPTPRTSCSPSGRPVPARSSTP